MFALHEFSEGKPNITLLEDPQIHSLFQSHETSVN